MKFLSNQKTGALYAISSGLCYSLIGYFGITILQAGSSVSNMLFWRFLISSFCTLILLIPQYKTISFLRRDNFKVLLSGMAFYSTSSIVFFMSSIYIGTGLAMIIFFIYPAIVMIINIIFYKVPFSKAYGLAFFVIIAGLVLLVDIQNAAFNIIGVALGVIAAIFYACYIVASEKVVVDPILATLMVSIGCSITCFISSLIDSSFYVPINMDNWLNIIGIGLICTALPILLLLQAMKYIDAEKASTLSVLEPVFVLIFGITLLKEKVTTVQIVGGVIVLSGALMVLFSNAPKRINIDHDAS
jgi:drug/metabolite transporter (DMT)-like permease